MQAAVAHPVARSRETTLVAPYLWAIVAGGAGVLAASLVGLSRLVAGAPVDAPRIALFVALVAGSYVVLRGLVLFEWRGQKVALAPDEALVVIALVALPPPALVLFPLPAFAIHQATLRRPPLRAISNLGVVSLASGAGAVSFTLLETVLPKYAAIPLAVVAYTVTTHLLVSSVFALREGAQVRTVFRERFALPTALQVALGLAGGVAIVALWSFHPLAVLALAPFAYLARQHVRLLARGEREALANRRLREVALSLAGQRDVDAVAARVLDACGELLRAGRVELVLDERGRERRWSRELEGGPHVTTHPIAAAFAGVNGGPAGALVVHASRHTHERFGEGDEQVLAIVAAETGAALANAGALRDLDAARSRLEAVLRAANDGVLIVGTDGLVRFANGAGRAMMGSPNVEGRPARELFEDVGFFADALAGRSVGHVYATHARAADRRFPAEVTAAAVREEGEIGAVLVVVRDATERKLAEEALLSSRVARPLVKRIVRTLMEETGADSMVLMHLGETLAREAGAASATAFLRAYEEMGFGRLAPVGGTNGRHEFRGEDLFEVRQGARASTCYLALGYLCGAVARQNEGKTARGAEVTCVSRGDAECRFMVNVREEDG